VAAGGRPDIADFVYNGFDIEFYQNHRSNHPDNSSSDAMGSFSRPLQPPVSWKGQHVLLEALAHCPSDVTAILVVMRCSVNRMLSIYTNKLQSQDLRSGSGFDFRQPLMTACDLVAHTSTVPEPLRESL